MGSVTRRQFLQFSGLQLDRVLSQQFRSTNHHSAAIDLRQYAASRNCFELAVGQESKLAIFCFFHDGACQRML